MVTKQRLNGKNMLFTVAVVELCVQVDCQPCVMVTRPDTLPRTFQSHCDSRRSGGSLHTAALVLRKRDHAPYIIITEMLAEALRNGKRPDVIVQLLLLSGQDLERDRCKLQELGVTHILQVWQGLNRLFL